MAEATLLSVKERTVAGKGAARAERKAGFIPGVIYGEKKPPVMFAISSLDLAAQLRKPGFWTRQFEIAVGANKYHAICQDIQTDPVSDVPVHVDFLRVSANAELTISVPVHYINDLASPGLKMGGTLNAIYRSLDVICKPKDIPEKLEVDLTGLQINDVIKLSNVKFPAGVRAATEEDITIASISSATTIEEEAKPAADAAAAAPAAAAAAPAAAADAAKDAK